MCDFKVKFLAIKPTAINSSLTAYCRQYKLEHFTALQATWSLRENTFTLHICKTSKKVEMRAILPHVPDVPEFYGSFRIHERKKISHE
jgi:hypothetical protein